MKKTKLILFIRIILGGTFIITVSNIIILTSLATEYNFLFISRSITAIIGFFLLLAILELLSFAFSFSKLQEKLIQWLLIGYHLLQKGWFISLIGYAFLLVISPTLLNGLFWQSYLDIPLSHPLFNLYDGYFSHLVFRVSIWWSVLTFGGLILDAAIPWRKWEVHRSRVYAAHWLIIGLVYEGLLFISEMTNFPFSLRWSEGSRLYYAWLFYQREFWESNLELPLIDLS